MKILTIQLACRAVKVVPGRETNEIEVDLHLTAEQAEDLSRDLTHAYSQEVLNGPG